MQFTGLPVYITQSSAVGFLESSQKYGVCLLWVCQATNVLSTLI